MKRRTFLTILGSAGVVSALGSAKVAQAGPHTFPYYADSYGAVSYTHLDVYKRQPKSGANARVVTQL